jgi:hypothetical protein
MHEYLFLVFLFLLSINYLLEIQIKNVPENISYNRINKFVKYTLIIVGILGSLIYFGEKKYEYGNDFNFTIFIFGKTICKLNKLKNINYLNSFRYIF